MKTVKINDNWVYTSIGKLLKNDRAELPDKEVSDLMRVLPTCMEEIQVEPVIESPIKRGKKPLLKMSAKGAKISAAIEGE